MKTFINKTLLVVILTIAPVISAFAQHSYQLEEKTLPVGEFKAVNVTDDFEVTLAKGTYSAKITVDNVLAPYVQVYVRTKTLYITYDEKSVPKDIKNLYKGKGKPDPVLRATVYMPELNSLTLSDGVTVIAGDPFDGDKFELTLADKAQVKNLTLNCTSANINMKKNSKATLSLNVKEEISVNTEGSADLKIIGKAESLNVKSAGSSSLILSCETESTQLNLAGSTNASCSQNVPNMTLQLSGTSVLNLNGETELLNITCDKNANLEANNFISKKVVANMSGNTKANVNVTDTLDVTLVSGSSLYYTGTPQILIGKVIKSTLAPYGSTAK